MNLTDQRAATRKMVRPIVAVVPHSLSPAVYEICGFVPVAHYGSHPHVPGEIGSVEYVRYVATDDAQELRYLEGEEAKALLASFETPAA